MKRILIALIFCLPALGIFAQQMPIGINYQAIARDNLGNELKNRNLNIRLSVIAGDPTGPVEYAESHSTTTDNFGLFNLVIGAGAWYDGEKTEFTGIDWASASHFLKVEVDFGQGFISMGTMQFLAVPYALYAATAGNTAGEEDQDKDPANELQVLSLEGQVLRISKGNAITLSDIVNDADADPENERQDLLLDQENKLKITNNPAATTVDLRPFLDNTDNQTLSATGNSISITGGNSITADVDSTNEIQILSSPETGKLKISKGNTIDFEDADADPVNEIQDLSLDAGDKLRITKKADAAEIDLGKYLDNTDNQTLSISGYELTLTPGNKVNIRQQSIAFKAYITGPTGGATAGDIVKIEFRDSLNIGPYFANGTFTVPGNGAGLYQFNLLYMFDGLQELSIFKNGNKVEDVYGGILSSPYTGLANYPFIMFLNPGDAIEIYTKFTGFGSVKKGMLTGYRIQ